MEQPRSQIDAYAIGQHGELTKHPPETGIRPGQIGRMGIAEGQLERLAAPDMIMNERLRLRLGQSGNLHAENLTRLHEGLGSRARSSPARTVRTRRFRPLQMAGPVQSHKSNLGTMRDQNYS